MPNNTTYKDLYTLVVSEIEKRNAYPGVDQYGNQLSKSQVGVDAVSFSANASQVGGYEITSAVMDILSYVIPPHIKTGLTVTAQDPPNNKVTVSAGTGVVGGKVFTLETDTTLTVPFDEVSDAFYIVLYQNGLQIERTTSAERLTIGKIVIPQPNITDIVRDKRDLDNPWDGYIVNFQELQFYSDAYGNLEEDSIDVLRESIGDILADNIIGELKLNENLKITNIAGTLELNSDSLNLYDFDENLLTKLNNNGVYFYRADGLELAKFTTTGARIGNILLNPNSLQSNDYTSGSSGFSINSDGSAEFADATIRGTLYADAGEIGGWVIDGDTLYGSEESGRVPVFKTSENVETGSSGVVIDSAGLRGYSATLGETFNIPTDGSAPTFTAGVINETVINVNESAVIRTSETVGDGSADSDGVLINSTGIYACEANQILNNANIRILANGDAYFEGTINSSSGQIGDMIISGSNLYGGTLNSTNIIAPNIDTSTDMPRIHIEEEQGIAYQVTSDIGAYAEFTYADGTKYGAGVIGYVFNPNYPPFSIVAEQEWADIRLYNRSSDPTIESGSTASHQIGDLICVNGNLKICTTGGSPGTFSTILDSASSLSDLSDIASATPTNKNVLIADGTDWHSKSIEDVSLILNATEVYNSLGDLKLQADIQGDVTLFEDSTVGGLSDGKALYIHRKASESGETNEYIKIFTDQYTSGIIYASGDLKLNSNNIIASMQNFQISDQSTSANKTFKHYGTITAASTQKYIQWQINDTTDNFELTREDSNIGAFDIKMPLIVNGISDFKENEAQNFVIENRTSDPSTPATGRMWIRTDL